LIVLSESRTADIIRLDGACRKNWGGLRLQTIHGLAIVAWTMTSLACAQQGAGVVWKRLPEEVISRKLTGIVGRDRGATVPPAPPTSCKFGLFITEKNAPFVGLPRIRAHWVRPEIVVQVAFIEWAVHGKLRHGRFLGFREDKTAREVVRETS
jgi:hypothetical protein